MKSRIPYQDTLYRLAQIGTATGMQLVRILERSSGNRYRAKAVEFGDDDATQFAEDRTFEVTNLAEPADVPGDVPADTDAVALDVEGRWVVFLRPAASAGFPAKVLSSLGGGAYSVREQAIDSQGHFSDQGSAAAVSAQNLAELSLGTGAAVDAGAIVLVTVVTGGGSPASLKYVFDHPAYAKYLD